MEDNLEQPIQQDVDSDIKVENGSNLGKFKDTESLLTAYNNLQSDYTKKCQTLSALQKQLEENKTGDEEEKKEQVLPESKEEQLSSEERVALLSNYIFSNEGLRDKLIAKYFDEIILPKSPKLIGSDRGSTAVVSPCNKPTTLEEAEQIVKDMFKQ